LRKYAVFKVQREDYLTLTLPEKISLPRREKSAYHQEKNLLTLRRKSCLPRQEKSTYRTGKNILTLPGKFCLTFRIIERKRDCDTGSGSRHDMHIRHGDSLCDRKDGKQFRSRSGNRPYTGVNPYFWNWVNRNVRKSGQIPGTGIVCRRHRIKQCVGFHCRSADWGSNRSWSLSGHFKNR